MKLRVVMSQEESLPPYRGDSFLPVENIDESKKYELIYNLTEGCSTTDKFVRLMEKMQSHKVWFASYNLYPPISIELFKKMKERMNFIIEEMKKNPKVPDVNPDFVLDVDLMDPEVLKLNALHLYFEDVSNMLMEIKDPDYNSGKDLYVYLEEINQLVHSMEGWVKPDELEFFGSCRLAARGEDHSMYEVMMEPLTEEDYANFDIYHKWGDLTLDYFRVGKDLMASFATNDVKLVETQGLCQQNTVHTCFEIRFKRWGRDDEPYYPIDRLEQWIKDNDLDKYYDFSKPEFTSGRVCLGKLDMTGKTKEDVMSELVKCTGIQHVELVYE